MKVLIYHPSKQHIYRILEGFEEYKIPYKFFTGMYYGCKKSNPVISLLGPYIKKNRFSKKINPENVYCINWFEELVFSFWAKSGLLLRKRNRMLFKKQLRFQKKILKYINSNISHIITFHTNAFFLFEQIRKIQLSGIKLILETTQPHPKWIYELYKKYPLYMDAMPLNYSTHMIDSYSGEFNQADIIITPSTFVKNTLIEYGVNKNKMVINFYGYNPLRHKQKKQAFKNGKIQIAFTGVVSPSKGFHFLKQVASLTAKIADYHIFGFPVNKNVLKDIPPNVHYHGFTPHDILSEYYSQMNIFYFPTLYDASGLALLEAMNSGLVPIASMYSIAQDVIKHNENGFIIAPQDIEKTVAYIELLNKDRDLLAIMSEKTQISVKQFTWSRYQKKYLEIVRGMS